MSSLFNFDVLCNTRLTGNCRHTTEFLRTSHFMVKNFKIKFKFTNSETSILSYNIDCNGCILYSTDVLNNEIVFEPLEPFYNGASCFGYVQLNMTFDTPEGGTYITAVHMVANMVDAMSVVNEKNPMDYTFKITDSITVRASQGFMGLKME